MNKNKALFVIGGMGPEASGYLYKLLIDLAIKEFGAKNNDDFPEIILHSIPVPDFISNDKSREEALKMLKKRVEEANNLNISCISIACNTAHILLPQLQALSKAPFVSMIEETVKQVQRDGKNKVGLLGTPSTIKYGLYQAELEKYGITAVIPSALQIKTLERIIRNVLKGKILKKDSKNLEKIADVLRSKGAEAIILGCTELPLVFPKKFKMPIYNSLEILTMTLLRYYYRQIMNTEILIREKNGRR